MKPDGNAITVERLVKHYGGVPAVNELSFDVRPGELFALLGPNGAGKTTTIEILEGYRTADAGHVRVLGLDPVRDAQELKPRVGVMLQDGGIADGMRALEALHLYAAFFRYPSDPSTLLERVNLTASALTPYRRLSGGQRQRLGLALALIGRPELVFLDEPTAGMDPAARAATWELVREVQSEGTTVVLTTHLIDEAERVADRVAIVNRGGLVAVGAPSDLVRQTTARELTFSVRSRVDLSLLSNALGVEASGLGADRYIIHAEPTPALVGQLASWLALQDVLLEELRIGAGTLEEVFLALTAGQQPTPEEVGA